MHKRQAWGIDGVRVVSLAGNLDIVVVRAARRPGCLRNWRIIVESFTSKP